LACYAIGQSNGCHVRLSQIGLMEHEEIVVKAEKMACVGRLFDSNERIEVASGSNGCSDPFCQGAGGEIALEKEVSSSRMSNASGLH
jgi:hypothetical protein